MVALTARQTEALQWIASFMRSNGCPPTYREIAAGLGLRSPNSVTWMLRRLERKGVLVLKHGIGRGIRLTGAACAYCGR